MNVSLFNRKENIMSFAIPGQGKFRMVSATTLARREMRKERKAEEAKARRIERQRERIDKKSEGIPSLFSEEDFILLLIVLLWKKEFIFTIICKKHLDKLLLLKFVVMG